MAETDWPKGPWHGESAKPDGAIRGRLDVQSRPGQGTRITITESIVSADFDSPFGAALPAAGKFSDRVYYIFVPRAAKPDGSSCCSHDGADNSSLGVSIVEDEDILPNLAHLIKRAGDFRLVSEHASAEDALAQIRHSAPDVLLMDINLPGMSGIECVRRLKSELPQVQIVMLTVYEDSDQIFQSLRAGASGYLLKRTPSAKLWATGPS
jgi:CheY-like chemotaxis protein